MKKKTDISITSAAIDLKISISFISAICKGKKSHKIATSKNDGKNVDSSLCSKNKIDLKVIYLHDLKRCKSQNPKIFPMKILSFMKQRIKT